MNKAHAKDGLVKILKTLIALGALLSVGIILCSCGGTTVTKRGNMQVQINWPARTRLVPQAADYITFSVYTDSQLTHFVSSFTGQRPATDAAISTVATSSTPFPQGTYYLQASAYANSDTIHPLATGVTSLDVKGGVTASVTVTPNSAVAQFKLTGALTATVTANGTVTGTPTLTVPAGGWGQAQSVTIEPEDTTGSALVLLASSSTFTVTASSNITVATGSVNPSMTQFTANLTPNGVNASSYVQVLYSDGNATNPTTIQVQVPVQIAAPTVNVTVTIPNILATVPATTNATPSPLVAVTQATLSDSGGAVYQPSAWTLGAAAQPAIRVLRQRFVSISYSGVVDKNLPFSSSATLQILDSAATWHTLLTATIASAQVLGSSTPVLTFGDSAVGNLTIGTNNLGSFNSGTWPATWGVTATVGGTQSTFSPTLFSIGGITSLTGTVLTGVWPNITAATLTSSTSSVNGSVSIPITFNNGAGSDATGAVTATILPLTGNGTGTIN